MLTTEPTANISTLLIVHDNKTIVGRAVLDVSGEWYFEAKGRGWFTYHTIEEIAALIKELNAPFEAHLKEYFEQLPKEINRYAQDDDFPF